MATIIEFRGNERVSLSDSADRLPRATAQIVIFPGVRVEYWEAGRQSQSAKPVKSTKVKPHRDLLEIE
jgi:hypothetical protein